MVLLHELLELSIRIPCSAVVVNFICFNYMVYWRLMEVSVS